MKGQSLPNRVYALRGACYGPGMTLLAPSSASPSPTRSPDVLLLVESPSDARFVRWVLLAAEYPVDRLEIVPASGKQNLASKLKTLTTEQQQRCAVLLDLDERNVPDATARAKEQLGSPEVLVFCAVPTLEAWLFADDHLAMQEASKDEPDEESLGALRRIPLPEEIPSPKALARSLFGPPARWEFVKKMNVQRAAARSPSLRAFLLGMGKLLGVSTDLVADSVASTLSRSVFAGLLDEIVPASTVVWRTASGGTYTAADLRKEIEAGTPDGRQYASDLLRISRDFLRRKASRQDSK